MVPRHFKKIKNLNTVIKIELCSSRYQGEGERGHLKPDCLRANGEPPPPDTLRLCGACEQMTEEKKQKVEKKVKWLPTERPKRKEENENHPAKPVSHRLWRVIYLKQSIDPNLISQIIVLPLQFADFRLRAPNLVLRVRCDDERRTTNDEQNTKHVKRTHEPRTKTLPVYAKRDKPKTIKQGQTAQIFYSSKGNPRTEPQS